MFLCVLNYDYIKVNFVVLVSYSLWGLLWFIFYFKLEMVKYFENMFVIFNLNYIYFFFVYFMVCLFIYKI